LYSSVNQYIKKILYLKYVNRYFFLLLIFLSCTTNSDEINPPELPDLMFLLNLLLSNIV